MAELRLVLPNGRTVKAHHVLCECPNKCTPEKIAMRKGGHFVPDAEWYKRVEKMAHEELIAGLY